MDKLDRPLEPTLVIYHADCHDGMCAAWVCDRALEDAEFVAAHYGDAPPPVDGRHVVIVDFSYPYADTLAMSEDAKSLMVLEHHKTAKENLAGLDSSLFWLDMERSGAALAWDYFFPDDPRPWLVEYVMDRDLWRWELSDSRAVNAWIGTTPYNMLAWKDLGASKLEDVIKLGQPIVRYINQYVEEMCGNIARMVEFEGLKIPVVNVPYKGISEVLGKLAETNPFSLGWFQGKEGQFVYSLRSRGEDAIDVSEIAKKYGGGGHKHSAGFTLDTLLTTLDTSKF